MATPMVKDMDRDSARAFAQEVLVEMEVAGSIDTLQNLIKHARCVLSERHDPHVLTLAVAEVFADHWKGRAH